MSTKNNRQVEFHAIREAISMERILEHYGLKEPMKPSGDSLSGCCTPQDSTNPTQFRVTPSKHLLNCLDTYHRCGDPITYIARKEAVRTYSVAQTVTKWLQLCAEQTSIGNSDEWPSTKSAARSVAAPKTSAEYAATTGLNPHLKLILDTLRSDHHFLVERGLGLENLAEFGLSFCSKSVSAVSVTLPIHDPEGQVVALFT